MFMSPQATPRHTRFRSRFPNEIRSYRVKAGLTQTGLGQLVGKSRTVVSKWERGLKFPDGWGLFALARHLNTLTEQLYYRMYRPDGKERDQVKAKRP